jgi:hypothetical protein
LSTREPSIHDKTPTTTNPLTGADDRDEVEIDDRTTTKRSSLAR